MVSEAWWNLLVTIGEPPMAVSDESGRRWVLGVALWARGGYAAGFWVRVPR
jgi:hypothetical protein